MALTFLTKNGYVTVKERQVRLTPLGREAQGGAPSPHRDVEEQWVARFGADDVPRLRAAVQHVLTTHDSGRDSDLVPTVGARPSATWRTPRRCSTIRPARCPPTRWSFTAAAGPTAVDAGLASPGTGQARAVAGGGRHAPRAEAAPARRTARRAGRDVGPGDVAPEQGRALPLERLRGRPRRDVLRRAFSGSDPRQLRGNCQRVWLNSSPLRNPKAFRGATSKTSATPVPAECENAPSRTSKCHSGPYFDS